MRMFDRGEKGGILKKGDTNKDEISVCVRRITSITPLKLGVAQEDTLCGFG